MKNQLILLATLLFISGCKTYDAKPYDFPKPVDTTDKEIKMQVKKTYNSKGVFADNQFAGARLNNFEAVNDSSFRVTISPENAPINPSPYYAFKLWSKDQKTITLELNYEGARHRYYPKISPDGKIWKELDESKFRLAADTVNSFLSLEISSDTLWVAGQEVQNSKHVGEWCQKTGTHPDANLSMIGKSKLGRDIPFLDINTGISKKKEIIVIISRQHPPEVTGWFAMRSFVDEIMSDSKLANAFRKKYRLLVYPLMNPDGVDLGHWRHNAGGVDLNRDWAYYNQPENRQIANHVVRTSRENKSKVILGVDFHSTYHDVYYTNKMQPATIKGFKDFWIEGILDILDTDTKDRPSNIGGPVSKNWFLTQFNAEGITYEIGDDTPRDFIDEKGRMSAREMMKLLVLRGE